MFDFANSISNELTMSLTELGIHVRVNGQSIVKDNYGIENITKLNLDITTLLTYVSSQANGSANWEFKELLLNEQVSNERQNPVKPFLDNLFEGEKYEGKPILPNN